MAETVGGDPRRPRLRRGHGARPNFVSAILAALWIWFLGFDAGVDELWITLLWLTPILWGALGVLWYDRALARARQIFEAYFTNRWW